MDHQSKDHYYDESLGLTLRMMRIPGGTFLMGSPEDEPERRRNEGPQHKVTVSAFFMAKYPVTQAQWRVVANLPRINLDLNPDPSQFKGDNRPVEQVNWYDAMEFCARLSAHRDQPYTLPSEAQWEYACRAGSTAPFHFGKMSSSDQANCRGTGRWGTTDVGIFPSNAFGLYDMHGNVWEWCLDYYHNSYEGAPTDGSAWLSPEKTDLRVLRGGSWHYLPRHCRSACRVLYDPSFRDNDIGLRVVSSSSRYFG